MAIDAALNGCIQWQWCCRTGPTHSGMTKGEKPGDQDESLLNVRKPVSVRLRQLYGGDRPLAIVAPDGDSQAVQFIKPNRFDGSGLPIAKDHGLADQFGLNLLELAEDRGRADHHSWHR
jgi:hypothetical protein